MQATLNNNQSQSQSQSQLNWTRFNSTFVIEIKRGDKVFTSTAVALGKRMLVTAAHCVDCADDITLMIGDDYKNPESAQEVPHWVVHPSYNPNNSLYENDLALLYLDEDLPHFTGVEKIEEDTFLDNKSFLERIGFGGRNSIAAKMG